MLSISRKLKVDLAATAFLTLLCCVLFADVWFGQRDFFIRDLTRYYHPTKSILREILLEGEFPWWNPYYAAGQPMAANPEYEVFYPLHWLILLPDFETGYRLHILVHVWLTAVGMYLFLRSLRLGSWASLFGAVAWGYGGLTLSLINLLPILFAAAWMPLIFLFTRRALRRFRLRDAAIASIAGGMQILVGEPTTLIQTWLIIGFYALWRIARLRRRRWKVLRDSAAIIGLVLLWSVLIGSVQLIPAIDHAGDTVRSRGFELDLVTAWSFPPQRLVELAYPHFFGRINAQGRTLWWAGSELYGRPASPFYFSIHLGALMAVLVIAGVAARGYGRGRWALFVTPFFLLALGRFTPLYRWLLDLGISVPFRYPEKFLLAILFGTTLFGSVLFQAVEGGDRRIAKRASIVASAFLVVSAVIAAICYTPLYERVFGELWGVSGSRFKQDMLRFSRLDWIVSVVATAVVTTLLGIRSRVSGGVIWAPLAVGALVIELVPIGLDASPRIQRSFYRAPEIVHDLPVDRSRFRIFHEVDWYGRSKTARKWFSTGRGVYWVVRNGLFPMTNGNHSVPTVLERDYDRTALLPTVDLVQSMWDVRDGSQKEWASIFMQMSNAEYRARYRDFESEIERVEEDLRDIRPVSLDRVESAPRYYLADELIRIEGRREFVEKLIREVPSPRAAFVSFDPFEPARGTVRVLAEGFSSIRLRVETDGKSLLVLSVTPHRYWTAMVNGRPAELEVVNVGYQGLVVGQGTSEIVLRYRNPVIVAMVPVSAGSLLLAVLALVSGRGADQQGSIRRRSSESRSHVERVDQHATRVSSQRDT